MKIGILTNFQDFGPQYSLTQIVLTQAKLLTRYGHEVHLFTCEQFNPKDEHLIPPGVIHEKKIPFGHLKDFRSENDITPELKLVRNNTAQMLRTTVAEYNIIITHDFIFQGWNMPFGLGCRDASPDLPNVRWMHWIHSTTSQYKNAKGEMQFPDWWDINKYGKKHKIIYPNRADITRVAEAYKGWQDDVKIIPHIKDLRTYADFDEETCKFIDFAPGVMHADIVQLYPCSVDRLAAKKLDVVMGIFANLKQMFQSVCLVVATQWCTGKEQQAIVAEYKKVALGLGLQLGSEVVFTADFNPKRYGVGIPKRMIRELFMCSNLFIFPTMEETFGLVLPEACLAGGVLPVLNRSLDLMSEITGYNALYCEFGSFIRHFNNDNMPVYLRDLAAIILRRMMNSESIKTKSYFRQKNNYDYLYKTAYAPILEESKTWI